MNSWITTTAEQDILEELDGTQHTRYCFSRDWGCTHDEALTIATDDTGRLFTLIMEKTFG
jgi:hypothetical protein